MTKIRQLSTGFVSAACFFLLSGSVVALDLHQQKSQLEGEVNALGRDVATFEHESQLPSSSRVEVFLSLSADVEYTPDTVSLLLDGKEVATHAYSATEIKSLRLGTLHTLWQGSLAAGTYDVQAVFSGMNRKNKPVQDTVGRKLEKETGSRAVELKVTATEDRNKPAFSAKDWGDKQ